LTVPVAPPPEVAAVAAGALVTAPPAVAAGALVAAPPEVAAVGCSAAAVAAGALVAAPAGALVAAVPPAGALVAVVLGPADPHAASRSISTNASTSGRYSRIDRFIPCSPFL
jgi:hypothetical protein